LPAIGGDEYVVGEDDRAAGELGTIDGLELPNGARVAVRLMGGLIRELEEVDEPGGIVLLLPGRVHLAARLVLGYILHELGDRGLDLVHRRRFDLVVGCLVDRHGFLPRPPLGNRLTRMFNIMLTV
jgi:hypothetical protein